MMLQGINSATESDSSFKSVFNSVMGRVLGGNGNKTVMLLICDRPHVDVRHPILQLGQYSTSLRSF